METFQVDSMWSQRWTKAGQNRYEKAANAGLEPCELCGRGVRVGQGFMVHATNGGNELADLTVEYEPNAGDMGWWVLGPECGRKIPAKFKKKYTE